MWFYNDSLHTGSICFQRKPFKAALASHVYYFLLLWQISIFSFDYFLKPTLPCLNLTLSLGKLCLRFFFFFSQVMFSITFIKNIMTKHSHFVFYLVFFWFWFLFFDILTHLFFFHRIPHFYVFPLLAAIFIG